MKSIHEQADIISAVPLLKREEFGEHIVYTVLSSDGVTKYRTKITRDGKPAGCTCPATVPMCKHIRAAIFEEEWTKPATVGELVAKEQEMLAVAEQVAPALVGETFAADLAAHIVDDLTAQPTIERKFRRENTRLGATEGFSLLA